MGPEEEILELRRQVERLSLFHEVGKALFSTLDLQKILQTIMEKISDLLQPDTWSLLMMDEDTQELYFEIAIGSGADKLRDVRLKLGEGVAGWVAQHGEPLLVEDTRSDPRFTPRVDELTHMETRSIVASPSKRMATCWESSNWSMLSASPVSATRTSPFSRAWRITPPSPLKTPVMCSASTLSPSPMIALRFTMPAI